MYIRHIDHRSGAPWGPHGREGGKKNYLNRARGTTLVAEACQVVWWCGALSRIQNRFLYVFARILHILIST